ncbi:winged helix-turn-helix transcriptional regulator [Deinococcus sp.]|uniref:winged helix-turn-helix transcriptional regulator n=1 Tax=Deinococcus sp. TaxID=47478 RepID=UPI003B5C2D98
MQAVKPASPSISHQQNIRSGCPVSLGLDIFGDKWTLLIVRDLMFSGKRHFRELLASDEGISSNILSDRLKMLLTEGIISKSGDPSHAQRVIYRLTEKGVVLLPILLQISEWSYQFRPVGEQFPRPAVAADVEAQMAEVRRAHLIQAS